MRAKTLYSNTLTQWLAVALIALAPLACIAYCRITHEVAHRAMGHAAMQPNAGDAPLHTMQQMVQAVTDMLPLQTGWITLMIFVAFCIALRTDPRLTAQMPPTPPPKIVVCPFAFR